MLAPTSSPQEVGEPNDGKKKPPVQISPLPTETEEGTPIPPDTVLLGKAYGIAGTVIAQTQPHGGVLL